MCGALSVALLGGCVEGTGDDPSDNTQQNADNNTVNSSDDSSTTDTTPIPPEERQQLVDQLPETSPLVSSLVNIVAAADREQTADEQGYEFRSEDHSARVMVRLESGADVPSGYRVDIVDTYDGYVTAYVHIDDLVPLAMEDAVRKIQRPPESRTTGGQQGL